MGHHWVTVSCWVFSLYSTITNETTSEHSKEHKHKNLNIHFLYKNYIILTQLECEEAEAVLVEIMRDYTELRYQRAQLITGKSADKITYYYTE